MQELYSYHVFLFPFQWHYTGLDFNTKPLEEKTALKTFCGLLNNSNWKSSKLPFDSKLYYNERNYFYDFVRDILYDDQLESDSKEPEFIAHYQYDVPADTIYYTIKLKNGREYKLLVESIILHLYNTGVGVLSFHLNNREKSQSDKNDILNINQFGRRLYPPYFAVDQSIIGKQEQYEAGNFSEGLSQTKGVELAESITLGGWPEENWNAYHNPEHFKHNPFTLPLFISNLFGSIPLTTNPHDFKTKQLKIFITPALDDRMFVVCWYGNNAIVDEIRDSNTFTGNRKENSKEYSYLSNEWLYKYVFIDGASTTCQNEDMRTAILKEHINARWLNYGSLYGVSRYSFVLITQELTTLQLPYINAAFLVNHVQTMYYKMVELTMVQRACLLRFADEVTSISGMMKKDEKYISELVSGLYKQYIRFVNKIYFREVTSQEQGIELYDLLHKHMRIDRDVKDLDNEIGELHNYVVMKDEQKRNKNLELLSTLGAVFIAPTFIAGFFGMNMFGDNMTLDPKTIPFVLFALMLTPITLLYLLKRKIKIRGNITLLLIAITLVSLFIIYYLLK